MDTRELQNYLKIELNQQSVQGSKSEYVNKLVVKVEFEKARHRQNVLWMEQEFCTLTKAHSSLFSVDEVESDKAQTSHERHTIFPLLCESVRPIVYDKLRAFCYGLCQACAKLVFLPLSPVSLSWTPKSPISCMPCKHKRKVVTFIGPGFICIPSFPSLHFGFYRLTQAKH